MKTMENRRVRAERGYTYKSVAWGVTLLTLVTISNATHALPELLNTCDDTMTRQEYTNTTGLTTMDTAVITLWFNDSCNDTGTSTQSITGNSLTLSTSGTIDLCYTSSAPSVPATLCQSAGNTTRSIKFTGVILDGTLVSATGGNCIRIFCAGGFATGHATLTSVSLTIS